jgi:PPE-repeat protein
MNFAVLPPEVTSAQMYTGAGSGPMLAAAASWAGLGDELGSAADSFSSVTSGLADGPWQGPASAAMAAVAAQYAQWLNASAAQAAGVASNANATAAIFDAAKAAITHPEAVTGNRLQLLSLVRSNLFGFNAPAIAATEGAYEEMWAQNVAALSGYHGAASAVVAQLAPWQQLPSAQATPAVALGATPWGQIAAALAPARTQVEAVDELAYAAGQAALRADLQQLNNNLVRPLLSMPVPPPVQSVVRSVEESADALARLGRALEAEAAADAISIITTGALPVPPAPPVTSPPTSPLPP